MSCPPEKNSDFDWIGAKKNLIERDKIEKENGERDRIQLFEKAVSVLENEFKETSVEVYLVGSITQPYRFTSSSDIDIVLKNFIGDRFELWTKLEEKLGREVEIILFEKSAFQEFVKSQGFKVI